MADIDFGGIFGGIAGLMANHETNEWNANIARHNRDMQWQMHEDNLRQFYKNRDETWQREDQLREAQWNREDAIRNELYGREDTSYQRSVADAQAAGLSPLAVQQLSAAGNPVVSSGTGTAAGSPPPMTEAPASYMYQSPAQDIATLVGAIASTKNINEIARHNKEQEKIEREKIQSSENVENNRLVEQSREFDAQLAQQKALAESSAEQSHSEFLMNYEQRASQFSAQLSQQQTFHFDEMRNKEKDRAFQALENDNKNNIQMGIDFAKSLNMKYYYYPVSDLEEYNKKISDLKREIVNGNRQTLNDMSSNPDKYLQSTTVSSSVGSGESAGVTAGNLVQNGTIAADVGKSSTTSSSFTDTQSDRAILEKIAQKYNGVLAIPVYVRNYNDWNKNYKGKY